VNENQVQFSQPLQHDAAVGIIGGGISGLACAQVLSITDERCISTAALSYVYIVNCVHCSPISPDSWRVGWQ
jgi:hypothetical protein